MTGLTMSQVAKEANVNIATVRYYEKRGLLCKPPRTEAGYRMFSYQTVEDIKFIKKAQDLGLTLEEIKHLLAICREEEYFPTEEMHEFAAKGYISETHKNYFHSTATSVFCCPSQRQGILCPCKWTPPSH